MQGFSEDGFLPREFMKARGRLLTSSVLASATIPQVHAASSNTLKIALVGCGGRGTGAVANALGLNKGAVHLVAMADVFENQLINSHNSLKRRFEDEVVVPRDARFVGFDAYQKAIDSLSRGDIVVLAAPPAFRWVHFSYAIKKGVHVFMEPPVSVDGPTTRRMLELAEQSRQKNMKVGVGLMARHCRARQALFHKIQDGELGEIMHMRAYRMHGPVGSVFSRRRDQDLSELLWQIQRYQSFLWASGGMYNDLYIHKIDECCWMKGQWPSRAQAVGGRHFRGDKIDQNFDNYMVEYHFKDGGTFTMQGRTMIGIQAKYSSYVHGTKGMGVVSTAGNYPAQSRLYKGHQVTSQGLLWEASKPEMNPYELEWENLIDAIQNDTPYHEVERGAMASLVASMGRKAAHTGQVVTLDEMLNHDHEFAPALLELRMDSSAPLQPGPDGRYPVPQPGLLLDREY